MGRGSHRIGVAESARTNVLFLAIEPPTTWNIGIWDTIPSFFDIHKSKNYIPVQYCHWIEQ